MQGSLRKFFLLLIVSAVGTLHAQSSGRDSIVIVRTEQFGSRYDDRKKASDIPNKPTETSYGELHYRDGKMISRSSTGRGPLGWDSSMTTIRYDASGRKKHSFMRQASSRQCFLSLVETDYSDSLIITRKHEQYYCADQVQHQFLTDTVFLSTSLLPDSSLHYEDGKLLGSRVFVYKFYDDGHLLEKKMISSGIYGSAGISHTVIYGYAYHGKDTLQTYTSSYLDQDTLEQSPFERVYDANGYEIMNIYRKGDSVTAILTYTRNSSGRIESYESRKPDMTVLGVGRYLYKENRGKHEQLYIGGNVSYLRTDTLVRFKSRRVNHYQSSAPLPAGTNSIPDKVTVKLYSSIWLNKEGLVTKKAEYKFGKPVSIQRYTYSYK